MGEALDCCSSYKECSENRECVHKDDSEYSACSYRKNLEAGSIFYGNKISNSNNTEVSTMENFKITIDVNAPELAKAINNLADAISGARVQVAPTTAPVQKKESKSEKTEKAEKAEKVTEKVETPVENDDILGIAEEPVLSELEEKVYTLEEVRAKLAALSQAGKAGEVKKLITDCGATKLTDIPADKYSELMKKAEKLA